MINVDGSYHKLGKIGGHCLNGSGDTGFCLISRDDMIDDSNDSEGEIISPQVTKVLVTTKISKTNIYMYYELGQLCFITKWGKCCYKLGKISYYKLGHLLQIRATFTLIYDTHYKLG